MCGYKLSKDYLSVIVSKLKLKKKKDKYSRNAALSPCPRRTLQRTFGVHFDLFIGYIPVSILLK